MKAGKKEKSLTIELCDLTPEEQELVNCYRCTDERGKRTILEYARHQKQEAEIIVFKDWANRNL